MSSSSSSSSSTQKIAHRDTVTALLLVQRWNVEKELWSQLPDAFRLEMRRVLATTSLILTNTLRDGCAARQWGKMSVALANALRSWSACEQDCYLFTPPPPERTSKLKLQWCVLLAHERLLRRVKTLTQRVSNFRKGAFDPLEAMLEMLLRQHEDKMRTSNLAHRALNCLEQAKALVAKKGEGASVNDNGGTKSSSGDSDDESVQNLLRSAKQYASMIPDKQWRDALSTQAESLSSRACCS